jgi:hypothetical protein
MGSDARASGERMMDGKEDKSVDNLAVVAGLIAAVKLARVDSAELNGKGSPRIRCALADSIRIAQMVVEEISARQ